VRESIRVLTEQAAAYSGAADEVRNADRIAAQDALLTNPTADGVAKLSWGSVGRTRQLRSGDVLRLRHGVTSRPQLLLQSIEVEVNDGCREQG
jgi:hypothetical protein